MAVPANRIGYGIYSVAQLKTLQEVITLVIFMFFSFLVLEETPNMKTILGFLSDRFRLLLHFSAKMIR